MVFNHMNTQKRHAINMQKGSAMLISVLFFVIISTIILTALTAPVIREVKMMTDLGNSKAGYYLAEAGMEDVVYRLKNNLSIDSAESLSLNGQTVNTTITDLTEGKNILSQSDYLSLVRKVEVTLTTGDGVAFNYGLQSGNGGFVLGQNAGIIGNVYANGDIQGAQGAYVTGSAVAASSISTSPNQSNDTPSTPSAGITFANTNSTQDFAQSFQLSSSGAFNKVSLYIKKTGSPSNATVFISSDSGGSPSSDSIASAALDASLVTTSYGWVDIIFTSKPTLQATTTYWIVIDASSNASRYYTMASNASYDSGSAKTGSRGGSWTATGSDGYFKAYIGGYDSTIRQVIVGQNGAGDARAHTVENSTVAGTIYCKTGSGNNKACTTSADDPGPMPMPVSDANIDDWGAAAEEGGVITGNLTLTGSSTTMGPKKIEGDLTIPVNHVLTLTGALYVTGTITLSTGAEVKLSPSYAGNSGIFMADGQIIISNNVQFVNSGVSGSNILAISNSQCPYVSGCTGLGYAIDIANNAGAVILSAQKGGVHLSNGAGAKEVTADKVVMDNTATVTYESGLINSVFSTGPSGGWEILSWQEVD
jgi:hypothetical protein